MAPTSNRNRAFTQSRTIERSVRSEISNFTWEVLDSYFKQNTKDKRLVIDTGSTIDYSCSWRFLIQKVEDEEKKYIKFGLHLSSRAENYCECDLPMRVAFEVALDLTRTEGGLQLEKNSVVTPKTMFTVTSKNLCYEEAGDYSLGQYVSATYDMTWTVENVHLRVEMLLSDTVKNEEDFKMKLAENKSKELTLDTFKNLLQGDDNFSDFNIKMADGKEFRVHRAILASQSPVFSKMFTSKMQETSTGTMEIVDLSSEAMEIILKFIYSGSMDDKWKNLIEELVYAGDKYELKSLMEFCDTMLASLCKPQNAIGLLKTAITFKLKTAEGNITEWISKFMTVRDVLQATMLANTVV